MNRFQRPDQAGEGQRATALELFYDLVFVFAVTQVSHLLLDDLTWRGAGQALLVLLVVWWAWNHAGPAHSPFGSGLLTRSGLTSALHHTSARTVTETHFVSSTAMLRRTPAAIRNERIFGFSFSTVALASDDVPDNYSLIRDSGTPSTARTRNRSTSARR